MRNLLGLLIALICLAAISPAAHAAKQTKAGKAAQPSKDRLVLMPLRVPEEDKSLQGAMETALVEGLQQKFEVLSGEQVAQKAREIFMKESRNTAKKDCDETRCMQDIAMAFQSELIATAYVTKREDGYFLALSIKNIFDNLEVYSKSLPCKNCDAYQIVDKLKELSGAPAAPPAADSSEAPIVTSGNANDPESALWGEVQKGNSADDYQAYLGSYPKGKYVALAKSRIKKLQEQGAAELAQQEQSAWDSANSSATEAGYQGYLNTFPQGRYAALATARIAKLKKEAAAEEAKQKREAAEAATKAPQPGKVFRDCPDCPEMVVVPAGSYTMGSSKGGNESPAHRVTLAKAFAIGKSEITRGQFAAFVSAAGYDAGDKCWTFEGGKAEERSGRNWRNPGYQQDDSHPVACINWNDAKAYVEWLSRKTGKAYQLPTESQWEYACRAGGQHEYCGSDNIDSVAWYGNNGQPGGNSGQATHPAATKQANAFGLYDMSGNVLEWTADSYHDTYNGAPSDGTEWSGDGAKRVLRGGSWYNYPQVARAAFRDRNEPAFRDLNFGFRLARMLP